MMRNFDKENMREAVVNKVRNVFYQGLFTLKNAKAASNTLAVIYEWADAMLSYH